MDVELKEEIFEFLVDSLYLVIQSKTGDFDKAYLLVQRLESNNNLTSRDVLLVDAILKLAEYFKFTQKYLEAFMIDEKKERLLQLCDVAAKDHQYMTELIILLKKCFEQEYDN